MTEIETIGRLLWGDHWQAEMAVALDVHRNTVSDWRRARMSPRPDKMALLRKVAEQRHAEVARALSLLPANGEGESIAAQGS